MFVQQLGSTIETCTVTSNLTLHCFAVVVHQIGSFLFSALNKRQLILVIIINYSKDQSLPDPVATSVSGGHHAPNNKPWCLHFSGLYPRRATFNSLLMEICVYAPYCHVIVSVYVIGQLLAPSCHTGTGIRLLFRKKGPFLSGWTVFSGSVVKWVILDETPLKHYLLAARDCVCVCT